MGNQLSDRSCPVPTKIAARFIRRDGRHESARPRKRCARKLRSLALAMIALSLTAVTLVVTAPAQAAVLAAPGTGTLSVPSGVRWEGCYDHRFSYSLALPPGTYDWDLDVEAVGPDGAYVSGAILAPSLGNGPTGSDTVQVCSLDLVGTYRLRAKLTTYDYYYNSAESWLPERAFTMRQPATKTTVKLIKTRPGKHKVRIGSSQERATGYFGAIASDVYLQKWTRLGWVRLRGTSTYTDYRGVATVWFKHRHSKRIKVRAVTVGGYYYSGSVSAGIRFR